ncbi:MAG: hypothetical protein KF727_14110 [Microbacteriaceae bacterium]|nr:hypothetical protein [Microbacteriaceae bacterium]
MSDSTSDRLTAAQRAIYDDLVADFRTTHGAVGLAEAGTPSPDVCLMYLRDARDAGRALRVWTGLVILVGVMTVVLLGGAVVLFFVGQGVTAAVAAAGSLVSGAGAKFLVDQRADARDRREAQRAAYRDLGCP